MKSLWILLALIAPLPSFAGTDTAVCIVKTTDVRQITSTVNIALESAPATRDTALLRGTARTDNLVLSAEFRNITRSGSTFSVKASDFEGLELASGSSFTAFNYRNPPNYKLKVSLEIHRDSPAMTEITCQFKER